MDTLKIDFKDHIAVVRLNRPKANALNMKLVQEMLETFLSLTEADYIHGVVLTADGNIFSAGLDVVELYGYDEEKMDRFWEGFGNLLHDLVAFPKPLVAAINGHAPAGGCVLSLCCDYRVMADGEYSIGLNEVPVGIVVPTPIVRIASHVLGPAKASKVFLNGLLMGPRDARDFGLVDDVAPKGEELVWAESRLSKWLNFSHEAWRKTKTKLRKPLLEEMRMPHQEAFGDTLRHWWSTESRTAVGRMVEELRKKKAAAQSRG